MPNPLPSITDRIVVYFSPEDQCWIAHSLRMDQIGTGERIVDAMATLIRGASAVLECAAEDETLAYLREAPEEIQQKARDAKDLPLEIYEVAHKMALGKWPAYLKVDVEPNENGGPFATNVPEEIPSA
jgi:hypothetical protein